MTLITTNDILLAELPIPPGPLAGVLAEARAHLLERVHRQGVEVAISHDFRELARINDEAVASGTWFPMLPATHPGARQLGPGNAFWIRGSNAAGEVVTVQAATLYDCSTRSIGSQLADLTVFYDNPAGDAPADEWCSVNSPAAAATMGKVVFTCSGWTRPDFQRRGLFAHLHRVSRLVSWLLWQPDYLFGLVEAHPKLLAVWSEAAMGPRHLDVEASVVYAQTGVGELPLHFMRFSRAQVFGDLAVLATSELSAVAA